MARTRNDLVTAVMRKLRLVHADETPSASDYDYIGQEYDDKLEEWRDDGLIYWSSTDDIPNVVFPVITKLLANEVSPAYGRATIAEAVLAEEVLKKELRRHMAKPPSG